MKPSAREIRKPKAGIDYPASCKECTGSFGPRPYDGVVKMECCPYGEIVRNSPDHPHCPSKGHVEIAEGERLIPCTRNLEERAQE